jgi:O-antigen/teichoic acid export membrane protein
MEELDIAAVTKRSIHGVFALVTRSFFIQLIAFVSRILLGVFLDPAVFGVYAVVTSVIAFLQYFSDIGLAAALIQKKEVPTQQDLATTFTMQQILVVTVCAIALVVSPSVGSFYHLQANGTLLFQALVVSFFLSSLKTIPSVLLERNLRFEKLVIPQIVETIFYYGTVVLLASKGFGVASFIYAVLLRGISGVITMYIVSPWKIQFGFSKIIAKKLLSFGIPFQTNSFIALLKDDLLIAYLGKVLPLSQVGYIGFAQQWAFAPLRLIMDNVIRITFPSFSRLQEEKAHLSRAIEKSLFALCLLIFPALTGLVLLAPLLTHLVPRYQKWDPALFSLTLFAVNSGLSAISTPLTNALNAIGKIKVSLYLMIFWTAATWILTPLGIYFYGFNSVAVVSAIISLSVVYVVWLMNKYVPISIVKPAGYPLAATIVMGIALFFLRAILPISWATIIVLIIIGIGIYSGAILLIARREVLTDIATIRRQFVK